MEQYVVGQRWISESEPELGLGTVLQTEAGRVRILFSAAGELRQYAIGNAPLKRVRFREGDVIKAHDNHKYTVKSVREIDGLVTYAVEGPDLPESQLSDTISFQRPRDRLLMGQIDSEADFEMRRRTLENQHLSRKSEIRGFVGGRIDLIPHQLYIAHEVSRRQAPRVLLSDEVGLGKTIEACLILHRLLLSGRASRVLILVPETLVHQWFVEMMRRFNVWLKIFDEERCLAIEGGQPDLNPFLDEQLVLASIQFLTSNPSRIKQAEEAGWDVLVVDEAHHLGWSRESVSPEYSAVEIISRKAEGLLLLTATPEQLGQESHFARLRLLDPQRYHDFDQFKSASGRYENVAQLAENIQKGVTLSPENLAALEKLMPPVEVINDTEKGPGEPPGDGEHRGASLSSSENLLEHLLDLHGPGRVMFRNTRAGIAGFPKRTVHLVPLHAGESQAAWVDKLSTEFAVDAGDSNIRPEFELMKDPRTAWLANLLTRLAPQKILLICRTMEKAAALDEALKFVVNISSSVFHEGLTLIERDRNAAHFAEEDGARLLICSEIGSEGRNFQFAHHLVLFDLPLNPELLEQRIGRLDRIGQKQEIQIHVPYLEGSPQEVLSRWCHEGLNAFETSLRGGNELLKRFGSQVHDLALEFPVAEKEEAAAELAGLIQETREARTVLDLQLEQGRDRLLEMNSFRPQAAQTLVAAIQAEDRNSRLQVFMLDVFDRFGVRIEELAPHTFALNAQGIITDAFPSIPEEGTVVTFDRKRALNREDVLFLSWDHPMTTGAMDLILDSEKGNSAFAHWEDPVDRTLLIEAWFVLEPVPQPGLHLDRFLPPTPMRIVVNHKPEEVTEKFPPGAMSLQKGNPQKLLTNAKLAHKVIPAMIQMAQSLADTQSRGFVESSLAAMNKKLSHEIERLLHLRRINDHVRENEIDLAEKQKQKLSGAIQSAPVRLDSLRLIWKGPGEYL